MVLRRTKSYSNINRLSDHCQGSSRSAHPKVQNHHKIRRWCLELQCPKDIVAQSWYPRILNVGVLRVRLAMESQQVNVQ